MDTLLADQPTILAPADDAMVTEAIAAREAVLAKAIDAALAAERARVILAGIVQGRGYDRAGVMKRSLQRLYPDMTDAEYNAHRSGRPWPDDGTVPEAVPEPVQPTYAGCGCEDCRRDRGELPETVAAPVAEPERTCECNECRNDACQGDCDTCDDHECEQCYRDHTVYDCCGYCEDCDSHQGDQRDEVCSMGRCHNCDHDCDH